MKILIIGSEGFIGSHCRAFFSAQGWETTGADVADIKSSVQYEYILLDPQKPDFDALFRNSRFDVCINASGSGNVGFSFTNPEKDYELNVENVRKMLEAIRNYAPACRFVNFSSAAVYGNPETLPIREDAHLQPMSPYGKNKLESEVLLKQYAERDKLRTASLRVFSAYGPGLRKQLFWDLYMKYRTAPGNMELFGTGKETRDFIFIDDLVRAIACVIQHGAFCGEVINIASGTEHSIATVADIFLSVLKSDKRIIFNGNVKQGDPMYWKADISLLRSLDFKPSVSIHTGIEKYIEWLLKESGLD
ncbi:MAG: NAD-dependent epimerase/dehydratase family protein [Bacteroidia bacterium]